MRETVQGLILRETNVGESDKLLTLLSSELGKIYIRAKGARSIKSKNASLCRLFTYGEFEFYEKNSQRWLASGSITESFFGLNTDIEGFSLAAYVADVAMELSGEGVRADGMLRTTLNTLYAIEKKLYPHEIIKGAFELFCAAHSGFSPDLTGCRECGRSNAETMYFDIMNGNFVCDECFERRSGVRGDTGVDAFETRNIFFPMSPALVASARYVLSSSPSRIFSFNLASEKDMQDLSRFGQIYLHNHLERGFDTLDFYLQMKKFENRSPMGVENNEA